MRAWPLLFALAALPVSAEEADVFSGASDAAKVHVASGFVCPVKIGLFERDAVGERDPETGTDFCAYSALDGVYGTITIVPLKGPYDPKTALVPDFQELEGTGAKLIGEMPMKAGPVTVYTRSYETTHLDAIHYRVQFAASAFGQWAVEATMEYASPRDDAVERDFLNTVYVQALEKIAGAH
jgi:hypothetical protein